jgi:hypothetical protein
MSNMFFTVHDYNALHGVVFRSDYPGYRPTVIESPNGDGALDTQKRYSHIAMKYLRQFPAADAPHFRARMFERDTLETYLKAAHRRAVEVAIELGVPTAFLPSFEHGALRVLEYPAGASSAPHTDVGLLTLNLYRDQPECLHTFEDRWGRGNDWYSGVTRAPHHLGRIAREIGLGPAATHRVIGSATPQHSIVYFAVPDHAAVLPDGRTVGEFITTEMAKMRYDK